MVVERLRNPLFFRIDEKRDQWPISFRGEFTSSLSFYHIIRQFLLSRGQDCPITQAPYALRKLLTTNWNNDSHVKMLDLMSYGALLRSLNKSAHVNGLAVGLMDHRTKQMKEYDQRNGLSFTPYDIKDSTFTNLLTKNGPFDFIVCQPDGGINNFPQPANHTVELLRFYLNPGGILLTQYPGDRNTATRYMEDVRKLGLCNWIGFKPQTLFYPPVLMIQR